MIINLEFFHLSWTVILHFLKKKKKKRKIKNKNHCSLDDLGQLLRRLIATNTYKRGCDCFSEDVVAQIGAEMPIEFIYRRFEERQFIIGTMANLRFSCAERLKKWKQDATQKQASLVSSISRNRAVLTLFLSLVAFLPSPNPPRLTRRRRFKTSFLRGLK